MRHPIAVLFGVLLFAAAVPAAAAQEEEEIELDDLPAGPQQPAGEDVFHPRITTFLVGSYNYQSRIQMVPEFAGGASAASEPGATNFRFDKFGIGVVQRFTSWLTASANAEVELHADRHSHGFDPAFGCPGTDPCVEQFGAEEPEVLVALDRFDVTATLPIGNGPTLSLGRFDVPFGIERHDEPLILTATTSYAFRFGRPERMTGFRVGYPFSPSLDVSGWIVNRWESETTGEEDFNDNNDAKSFGGRIGVTPFPLEGMLNIGIGGFWGPEKDGTTSGKRWVVDLDFTWTPLPPLLLAGELLYGEESARAFRERGGPIAAPATVQDVRWRGGYLFGHYDVGDWLGVSARYDVLDDVDGGRTGVAQTLQSFTVGPVLHLSRLSSELGATGVAYARTRHPIDWVDLRLEYRLNRSDRPVFSDADPGTAIVTADGTSHELVVQLVVNSIFR